jgi:nucleoside-diphosphate-sugar epimerase
MQILVTGGGGFLGTYVIKELLKRSHYLVSQFSRNHYFHLEDLGVPNLRGDLRNKDDIEKALIKGEFEGIIHLAANKEEWRGQKNNFDINYQGTLHLLEVSKKLGIKKLLYVSPSHVFLGNTPLLGVDESIPLPTQFLNSYLESKSMAERAVLQNNQDDFATCALRLPPLWGAGDPRFIPQIIQKARRGQLSVIGDGENLVDILYVENAASAIVNAFEHLSEKSKLSGESFFISPESPIKIWDFISRVLDLYQIPFIRENIPLKSAERKAWILEKIFESMGISKPAPPLTKYYVQNLGSTHYFLTQKARLAFDYQIPFSFEESFKKTFSQKEKLKLSSKEVNP